MHNQELANKLLEQGIQQLNQNNITESIESLYQASLIFESLGITQKQIKSMGNLGHAYCAQNELNQAFSSHKKAFELARKIADYHSMMMALGNLGDIHEKRKEYPNAINCYQEVLRISEENHDTNVRIQALIELGLIHNLVGHYTEAINRLQTAINSLEEYYNVIEKDEEYFFQKIEILRALGYSHISTGKYDEAEKHLKSALRIAQKLKDKKLEAFTYNNLAALYIEQNDRQAIEFIEKSLKIKQSFLDDRQILYEKNNLGNFYCTLKEYEQAIKICEETLAMARKLDDSYGEALALSVLGEAYYGKGQIDVAIEKLQHSLQIALSLNMIAQRFYVARQLGEIAFSVRNWKLAIAGYDQAILVREKSWEWSWTVNSQDHRVIIEHSIGLYQKMVEACIKDGQLSKALENVERSKASNLKMMVFDKTIQSLISPELDNLLRKLDLRIEPENKTALVQSISFKQLQELIDDHSTIIEWYFTPDKFVAFIVNSQNNEPKLWQSSLTDKEHLLKWLAEYFSNPPTKKEDFDSRLRNLASILHIDRILDLVPDTCTRLILVPYRFLHLLPLHALPIKSLKNKNNNLQKQECLMDLFPDGISYVPNCWLLRFARQHQDCNEFQQLFAVQNPIDNLKLTNFEITAIQSIFSDSKVEILSSTKPGDLAHKLKQNLSSAHYCHFSCHGKFYPGDPFRSFLLLTKYANPDDAMQSKNQNLQDGLLTINDIFDLDFQKCRLITLSACETGKVDIGNMSDNYIGFPGAFMYAGSPSVVSTLWEVDEIATSFLMIKFHECLKDILRQHRRLVSGDVAKALNNAQQWLRFLTIEELDSFLYNYQSQFNDVLGQLEPGLIMVIKARLDKHRQRRPYPFINPYYWAAFIATGD